MSVADDNFDPSGSEAAARIQDKLRELIAMIEALPPGRRRSVALMHLETAAMWIVSAAMGR